MPHLHTHYDNLKVAKDAPMEVIHAAYRSLAAMYDPDLHPGDEEAARIMRVINNSYVALCDPKRKYNHDRWISEGLEPEPPPPESKTRQKSVPIIDVAPRPRLRKYWMWLAAAGIFVSVILFGIFFGGMPDNTTPTNPVVAETNTPDQTATSDTALDPRAASPDPQPLIARLTTIYTRPQLAPNGEPWPSASGYLAGYALLNADGQSSVTIDNRKMKSDVLAELYDLGTSQPVRVIFLLAGDWLKLENIDAGEYDLRYQDLESGSKLESESFPLKEKRETIQRDDGATLHKSQASDDTITLYVTPDGKFKFRKLGPGKFP